jgi:uncharacterized protein (TIGR02246 family)
MAQHAEDELAIRTLIAAYSDAIMCRDGVAAASVFADDGVLHAFNGPEVAGRTAIEAALVRRTASTGDDGGGFGVQMTMTVGVRIDGDIATARSHYLETGRGAAPGVGRLSMGSMEDTFRRIDGHWCISHRRLKRVYVGDIDMPGKTTPRDLTAWLRMSAG